MDTESTDVLVVGAGPTGLMAANWLQRLGVDAVAVDPKPGPTRESRALGVHSRSMEVYRQLGLADRVLERSVLAERISPGVGRRVLGSLPLGRIGRDLTPFPGIRVFEQSANEELLAGRLADTGRPVRWGTGFAGLRERADGVEVDLDGPDGRRTLAARYVIAADGASSPVRKALGIGFGGATYGHVFYVLDANGVRGTRPGITLRLADRNFMLGFPMGPDGAGGDRVRLLGIVRRPASAGDDDGAAGPGADIAEAAARAELRDRFGVLYTDAEWFATYRTHHRVAAGFSRGRVFLAGDAAHVHSPVGAQGMNTGLQDAHNLACKLADVLAGRRPPEYLGQYAAERRPVALRLVETTDRVFAAVTAEGPLARAFRTRLVPLLWSVALPLVPRSPAGGRLFGYLSQVRIHYWIGEESRPERFRDRVRRRHRLVGRRLPWVPDAGGDGDAPGTDNHAACADAAWHVQAYGPAAAGPGRDEALRRSLPLRTFRAAPDRGLPDGTVLVVRPDMYIEAAPDGRST